MKFWVNAILLWIKIFDKKFILLQAVFDQGFNQFIRAEIGLKRESSRLNSFSMNTFLDQLRRILFLDIETASVTESHEEATKSAKRWMVKEREAHQNRPNRNFGTGRFCSFDRAGIQCRVLSGCLYGVGYFQKIKKEKRLVLRIQCISHETGAGTFFLEFKLYLKRKIGSLWEHNGERIWISLLMSKKCYSWDRASEPLQIAGKKLGKSNIWNTWSYG